MHDIKRDLYQVFQVVYYVINWDSIHPLIGQKPCVMRVSKLAVVIKAHSSIATARFSFIGQFEEDIVFTWT